MIPIIYPARVNVAGGLWSSKVGGEFSDGDPLRASHIIEGRADIKELGSNLRLFFQDIEIQQRRIILSNEERLHIVNTYVNNKKNENIQKSIELGIHPSSQESNNKNSTMESSMSNKSSDDGLGSSKKAGNNKNGNNNNTGGNLTDYDLHPADELMIEDLMYQAIHKHIPLPNLSIYLAQKKPKIRMTDIHKTGYHVKLSSSSSALSMQNNDDTNKNTFKSVRNTTNNINNLNTECYFGQSYAIGNFEASLTNMTDCLSYFGLMIVKQPQQPPVTTEPIVYGFIKLESSRMVKMNTGVALHLTHIADRLVKVLAAQDAEANNATSPTKTNNNTNNNHTDRNILTKSAHDDTAKTTIVTVLSSSTSSPPTSPTAIRQAQNPPSLKVSSLLNDIMNIHKALYKNSNNRPNNNHNNKVKVNDTLSKQDYYYQQQQEQQQQLQCENYVKPLRYYRQIAMKAFTFFQKTADGTIDLNGTYQLLDYSNIFLLHTQIQRIFTVMDSSRKGLITLSEFENILMAIDILDPYARHIQLLDVYDGFKMLPNNKLTTATTTTAITTTAMINGETDNNNNHNNNTNSNINNVTIGHMEGLDFSGYCEAIEYLGMIHKSQRQLIDSFTVGATAATVAPLPSSVTTAAGVGTMSGMATATGASATSGTNTVNIIRNNKRGSIMGGGNRLNLAATYLTLEQFKIAWVHIIPIDTELQNRHLKKSSNTHKNMDSILNHVDACEMNYFHLLHQVNRIIENIKSERRIKKDTLRKEQEAFRAKLQHEADRFKALREKEKRLNTKKTATDKMKTNLEEKALRNELLKKEEDVKEMTKANKLEMKLKAELELKREIERQGWNRLDLSLQSLRDVPLELYNTAEAQQKLNYAIIMDLSMNDLENVPGIFVEHLIETRTCSLAQNKLKSFPAEIQYMTNLEILDIRGNKLAELPSAITMLQALKRLNVSNNTLTSLPVNIGECIELQHISLHSNNLTLLPLSLTHCTRLTYLDLSYNQIQKLPDTLDELISLVYLNLHSNVLTHLPYVIGGCKKLQYLNISSNRVFYLPESFSQLAALEICLIDNNELSFNQTSSSSSSLVNAIIPKNTINNSNNKNNNNNIHNNSMSNNTSNNHNNTTTNTTNNAMVMSGYTFNSCSELKELNLSNNKILELYADIGCCCQLQSLNLSNNQLSFLPPEIGLCSYLQILILNNNQLVTLPAELSACKCLLRLEVQANQLADILDETIGLIKSLQYLDMSCNKQLIGIPQSIIGLQKLEVLLMSGCSLSALPANFKHLVNLKVLDLAGNTFSRFPVALTELSGSTSDKQGVVAPGGVGGGLQQLDLCGNQIMLLPRPIYKLAHSLTRLNLSRNRLIALPVEFIKVLESVAAVDITDNAWTDLPPTWIATLALPTQPESHSSTGSLSSSSSSSTQLVTRHRSQISHHNNTVSNLSKSKNSNRFNGGASTSISEFQKAPFGYDVSKVLEFLYNMRVFIHIAEKLWNDNHDITLKEFIYEIQENLGEKVWREELTMYVEHVYFKAKQNGYFPTWCAEEEIEHHHNDDDDDDIDHQQSLQSLTVLPTSIPFLQSQQQIKEANQARREEWVARVRAEAAVIQQSRHYTFPPKDTNK